MLAMTWALLSLDFRIGFRKAKRSLSTDQTAANAGVQHGCKL